MRKILTIAIIALLAAWGLQTVIGGASTKTIEVDEKAGSAEEVKSILHTAAHLREDEDSQRLPPQGDREGSRRVEVEQSTTEPRRQANAASPSLGFSSQSFRGLTPADIMLRALRIPRSRATDFPSIYLEVDAELRQVKKMLKHNDAAAAKVLQDVAIAMSRQGISSPYRGAGAGAYRLVQQRNKRGAFSYYVYYSDCAELSNLRAQADYFVSSFASFVTFRVPRWRGLINKKQED